MNRVRAYTLCIGRVLRTFSVVLLLFAARNVLASTTTVFACAAGLMVIYATATSATSCADDDSDAEDDDDDGGGGGLRFHSSILCHGDYTRVSECVCVCFCIQETHRKHCTTLHYVCVHLNCITRVRARRNANNFVHVRLRSVLARWCFVIMLTLHRNRVRAALATVLSAHCMHVPGTRTLRSKAMRRTIRPAGQLPENA